ncbi:MAG: ABC transporter substrate-binding protein [Nostoc sp. S4]|nr:ABC transporter substrate-binding protein [Nostoc sp. S4]
MSPNSQNPYGINPYIIGTPIGKKHQLFGRETLLKTIEDSLQQNAKFILLYGQRRIGKSSLLKNIPLFISQDQYLFVPCDFQEHHHSSLGEIIYAIAREIFQPLDLDTSILQPLLNADLITIRRILNNRVLPQVYDKLDNKKLVLLLDEFDVVTQNDTEQAVELLHLLENLVRRQEELFVIAVVGRYLDSMPNLVQSFRGGIYQEIGLLDSESTKQQITQPANNILQYQEKTIEEIIKFSAGHPYYTQVLCHAIFNQARDESSSIVIPASVNDAVNQAIENAEGGLASIWDGLSVCEQVVFSAVADAQKRNTSENPLKLLEEYGLVLTNSLEEAIQLLINKGFLDRKPVKVKVEFVCLWLLQCHQLRAEIRSLETLEEQNVNQLLFVARNCWIGDKQQDGLDIYEQVLKLNPNHFSTIVELAEKYLQKENFDKALKLYGRAYKLDQIRYQEELIKALDFYGYYLINQKKYISAKQQYQKILQIQPENSLAKQKLAEIRDFKNNRNHHNSNFIQQVFRSRLSKIIIVFISAISIIFFSFLFNNCLLKEKLFLINCTENVKISKGERTLFPDLNNRDLDNVKNGIDKFYAKDYISAEEHFKAAINNNHDDPEILIYQNNARAIQQSKPLTLAAVIPATNRTDVALEMLRGMAQAQNQFNQQGGFKNRLLEIIIADDENQGDKAKLVAKKLVNDKLLGVIGHNSSDTTKEALPTYEEANLAVISPTSSSTEFQSRVFYRTINSNKVTGTTLAKYAWKVKLKKVVIFCNPKDTYSNTMREEFRVKFMANYGAEIVGVDEKCINLADPNFNIDEEVKKIVLKNQAQAIVLFPDTQNLKNAGRIAKAQKVLIDEQQQKGNNIQKLKLLGGDVLYNYGFLKEYNDALEGLVLSPPWFREAKQAKNFAQTAKDLWGGKEVSWRTATSFDATQAFIGAFKLSSNPSQKTVLDNLLKVKISSNNTSGDELVFDKNTREMKREEILITVQNGRFVLIPK